MSENDQRGHFQVNSVKSLMTEPFIFPFGSPQWLRAGLGPTVFTGHMLQEEGIIHHSSTYAYKHPRARARKERRALSFAKK